MIQRSLAVYSLLCALFLIEAGSTYIVSFGLQPSIQPVQQGIPGLGIPGQEQQQQQQPQAPPQQSTPPSLPPPPPSIPQSPPSPPASLPEAIPQQQGPNQGIIAHGVIDSLILTPTATWIAAGNWTIGVNNGNAALVTANMTWYNDNGTSSHTHEILNFRPFAAASGQGEQQSAIVVQPDSNSLSLRGVVDVGANHRISWNGVQSAIDIKKGGKILSISLDDAQTNDHFGGRPIFGVVTSFTPCSDQPGPNMEMLQPCLNIPVTSPAPVPQPTVTAPSSPSQQPPPTAAPVSPPSPATAPPTIPANNTIQNPTNPTVSSPTPLPSSSTPPRNITISRPTLVPPAVTSNATGKSPFDVLGGG